MWTSWMNCHYQMSSHASKLPSFLCTTRQLIYDAKNSWIQIENEKCHVRLPCYVIIVEISNALGLNVRSCIASFEIFSLFELSYLTLHTGIIKQDYLFLYCRLIWTQTSRIEVHLLRASLSTLKKLPYMPNWYGIIKLILSFLVSSFLLSVFK